MVEATWTLRKCLILERYVDRSKWHENRVRWMLAGAEVKGEEPDWFGLAVRIPINPHASLEDRLKQWRESVQPRIDAATAQGKFIRRIVDVEKESR